MVASVMTPKVPSAPRKSRGQSGPAACCGTGAVRMISPVGSTICMLSTMSSALPYLVLIVPVPRGAR